MKGKLLLDLVFKIKILVDFLWIVVSVNGVDVVLVEVFIEI